MRFHERTVVAKYRIEVFVARSVRATTVIYLPDASRAVDERLVETAVVRLIGFFVAKVPLTKDPRRVARRLQHLRQRGSVERHAFALENRVRHPVLHRMPPRHQRGTRG